MIAYVRCAHCGLPFELPPRGAGAVLSCPRCHGQVDSSRPPRQEQERPVDAVAILLVLWLLLAPCWGVGLRFALREPENAFPWLMPFVLAGGGFGLWRLARQALK
jgi:hypothetical protein